MQGEVKNGFGRNRGQNSVCEPGRAIRITDGVYIADSKTSKSLSFIVDNKINHVFVVHQRTAEIDSADGQISTADHQSTLLASNPGIAHLYKNQLSLSPFEQAIAYTLIDLAKAVSLTDPSIIKDKVMVVSDRIEARMTNLESVLFTVDNTSAVKASDDNDNDDDAEWLTTLYLTVWLAKRLQTTVRVAYELVVTKIPRLSDSTEEPPSWFTLQMSILAEEIANTQKSSKDHHQYLPATKVELQTCLNTQLNQFVTDKHHKSGPLLNLTPTVVKTAPTVRWKDSSSGNKAALTQTASWFNGQLFLIDETSRPIQKPSQDHDYLHPWQREPHRLQMKALRPVYSIMRGTQQKVQVRRSQLPSVKDEDVCNIGSFFESVTAVTSNGAKVRRVKEGFLPVSRAAQLANKQNFFSATLQRPANLPPKKPESKRRLLGRQRSQEMLNQLLCPVLHTTTTLRSPHKKPSPVRSPDRFDKWQNEIVMPKPSSRLFDQEKQSKKRSLSDTTSGGFLKGITKGRGKRAAPQMESPEDAWVDRRSRKMQLRSPTGSQQSSQFGSRQATSEQDDSPEQVNMFTNKVDKPSAQCAFLRKGHGSSSTESEPHSQADFDEDHRSRGRFSQDNHSEDDFYGEGFTGILPEAMEDGFEEGDKFSLDCHRYHHTDK